MSDLQDRFPFVDLANAEHRRVRLIVRSLEQAMRMGATEKTESVAQTERVVELLGDLSDELRRHFLKENEGGILEEAACRVPGLATRIAPVLAAWPAMVARVEALRDMARDYSEGERIYGPLATMIHRVLVDVVSLESSEEEILGSAFGVNLDPNGPKEESR